MSVITEHPRTLFNARDLTNFKYVCVCVCVCIYIYIYIYVCVCARARACVFYLGI